MNLSLSYSVYFFKNYSQCLKIGVPYQQYSNSSLRISNKINDTDFYRVDQIENCSPDSYTTFTKTPSNECLFFGVPSIHGYISTFDRKIFDSVKDITSVEIESLKENYYTPDVYEFNTIEEEVVFVDGNYQV